MSIVIEKGNENELFVSFTYSYDRVCKIKKIEGHRWNPKLKHWIVPNNMETINKIILSFMDEEIIMDPYLNLY